MPEIIGKGRARPSRSRHPRVGQSGDFLDETNDLEAVAGLVVVPDVQDTAISVGESGLGVDDIS